MLLGGTPSNKVLKHFTNGFVGSFMKDFRMLKKMLELSQSDQKIIKQFVYNSMKKEFGAWTAIFFKFEQISKKYYKTGKMNQRDRIFVYWFTNFVDKDYIHKYQVNGTTYAAFGQRMTIKRNGLWQDIYDKSGKMVGSRYNPTQTQLRKLYEVKERAQKKALEEEVKNIQQVLGMDNAHVSAADERFRTDWEKAESSWIIGYQWRSPYKTSPPKDGTRGTLYVTMVRGKHVYEFPNFPYWEFLMLFAVRANVGTYWWKHWLWKYSTNPKWKLIKATRNKKKGNK